MITLLLSLAGNGITITLEKDSLYGPHFELPVVPEGMPYEDFRTLAWKFDPYDYVFASLYPGYFHFMIREGKWGWMVVLGRLLSTGVMVYGGARLYSDLNGYVALPEDYRKRLLVDMSVLLSGFAGNLFFYAFDIGHAKWLLREKQLETYYKYRTFPSKE